MVDRESVKKFLTRVIFFYNKLDICQKLYFNLIVFSVLFFISLLFSDATEKKIYFVILLIYWTAVVSFEAVRIYKKIYSFTLGKASILIGFTLCTNISLSIAGVVVNDITGVSPSNFPHALILIAIATIPLMTAIIMLLIYIVIFTSMTLWGPILFLYDNNLKKILFPGYEPPEGYFLHKTTRLIQIISMGLYCAIIYGLFHNKLDDYTKFLYDKSQSFIYTFEMFSKSPCTDLPPGKVAFINDDHVLHASDLGEKIIFKIYTCEYKKG
ncbi:hypothetical protein ABEG61_11845 [Pantoea agglomerans]|uniref:hypothetical protein n=1 Tax=Enterobacter agglomerans TaxID=549 RepID=UPI00320803B4